MKLQRSIYWIKYSFVHNKFWFKNKFINKNHNLYSSYNDISMCANKNYKNNRNVMQINDVYNEHLKNLNLHIYK